MEILMFGWEFPPIQSGGLGVACQGIVDGLIGNGHVVHLVLPKTDPKMQMFNPGQFKLLAAHQSGGIVKISEISSTIYSPYASPESYKEWIKETIEGKQGQEANEIYGKNIFEEVHRYAMQACIHAKKTPHDVIHTHDWLTAEAGIQAKKLSGQPHVMHVHATEFDRSGENPNQQVYDMERRGMEHADRVIAVSEYTKKMLMKHYGIADWKIDVVHNAVQPSFAKYHRSHHLNETDKIVLFLGRMTMQKGPDYFLHMAKRVLEHMPRTKFIMAGDGDMMNQIIHMAAHLGIERNVLFSGFLKGDEIARAYSNADLYVMPSVSEPFGITPLEAIRHGAPVIISRQSGVSEVIKNALRVDFWDVEDMAHKVLAVLKYPALSNTMREHGSNELNHISWHKQAQHIANTYQKAIQR